MSEHMTTRCFTGHRNDLRARSALATLLAFAAVTGLPPALLAQSVRLVHEAVDGRVAYAMDPRHRAAAVTQDGTLWMLMAEHGHRDSDRLRLLLMRSADGGLSWQCVADTPTVGDGEGSVVGGPDGRIHAIWHADEEASWRSVFYQAFDPVTLRWVDAPVRLAKGTAAEDQYIAGDLEITAAGTLVATLQTYARPPRPTWRGGHATGLLVKKVGDLGWRAVEQVNIANTGGNAQIVVHGETAHIAYTTVTAGFGVHYRSYDTVGLRWLSPTDVMITEVGGDRAAANSFSFAADGDGRLFLLYAAAAAAGAAGAAGDSGVLVIASAMPDGAMPDGEWTRVVLAQDPLLRSGNVHYLHFALVNGPGNDLVALYSKISEQHRLLHACTLSATALRGRAKVIATAEDAGAYARLNGVRSSRFASLLYGVVSSAAGRVSAIGLKFPVKTAWRLDAQAAGAGADRR